MMHRATDPKIRSVGFSRVMHVMLLTVVILSSFVNTATGKVDPPGTAAVMDDADVVAVIKVHWVLPVVRDDIYHASFITASVLETFKGHIDTAGITIKTISGYEDSDRWCYWPEHTYLACLSKKDGIYRAVLWGYGIFHIDEYGKVRFWASPKIERPDFNRQIIDYQLVKKQVIAYLTKHHKYQRDTLRAAFTCPPVPSPQVGPTIKSMVKESTLVALIEPQWVRPVNRPEDKKAKLHSRVDAKVVEVIKGDKRIKNVVIGTSLDAKTGDGGSYYPPYVSLVFLKKEGEIYRAVQGKFGVFDMEGRYVVLGWPRDGKASLPRSQRILGTKTVAKAINAISSAK